MDASLVIGLIVAACAFLSTLAIATVAIASCIFWKQDLEPLPQPIVVPRNSLYEQSGVWGKDKNGRLVDLRSHDPARAARALGLTARYAQWIEDSRTEDDEIIVHEIKPYTVH